MDVGLGGSPTRRFGPYPGTLGFVGAPAVKYVGDKLWPNQSLHINEGLKSRNGRVRVVLQSDGNCVLYGDNQPLWWTGARPDVKIATMQGDGNFVLNPGAVWASDTSGHPGGYLFLQDDANLVLYWRVGGSALWSSQTAGFSYYGGPGKPITLDDVLEVASDVVSAAEVVVSFVPVIGTGINAAIAAGVALAKGANIDDAFIEGAKNALPGGPVAAQALDAGIAAVKAIAQGKSIGDIGLAAAREAIPSDVGKKAFDVGVALAHGQNVQQAIISGAASLAANALAPLALPDSLQNIAKSLPPETTRVATAIFNRPELQGKSVTEIAAATKSDPATVTQATQAVGSAWQALASLTPAQQKALAGWATLSKLSPDQQKALVALAKKKPPTLHEAKAVAVAAKPKPKTKAPVLVASNTPKKPTGATMKAFGPYPKSTGAVSAPPPHGGHHGGGGHHDGGHGGRVFRGGRRVPGWGWCEQWATELVVTETCQTWSDPVSMPISMQTAAKVAVGASGGRPTTLRGDDGRLYQLELVRGVIIARVCVASA